MIDIDFYKEAVNILTETEFERNQHFIELNKQICEYYHIENQGEFDTKSMKDENGVQTDIGTFDVFSKTMFLEKTYVSKPNLSQIQLFEIIESLLHEPKHLKQLLEYEKDNSTYPGIYTSMHQDLDIIHKKKKMKLILKLLKKCKK